MINLAVLELVLNSPVWKAQIYLLQRFLTLDKIESKKLTIFRPDTHHASSKWSDVSGWQLRYSHRVGREFCSYIFESGFTRFIFSKIGLVTLRFRNDWIFFRKFKPLTKLEFCQVPKWAAFYNIVNDKKIIFIMRSFNPQNHIFIKDQTWAQFWPFGNGRPVVVYGT